MPSETEAPAPDQASLETPPAPESAPAPTPSTSNVKQAPVKDAPKEEVKKRETKKKDSKPAIKYTISNLQNLSIGQRSSVDYTVTPHPPEPKPVGTYFNSLNLKSKLTTDKGSYFTIDVQPDMRFFTYYAAYTTCEDHSELVIDNNPYVSIISLIGYKLYLLSAQLLLFDIHARQSKSAHALPFEDQSRKTSLLNLLMNCHVPPDVQLPLEQLAPTLDPLRPDLEFVPNFACFSLLHDFGRTIPPYIFFMIHNILANVDSDATPVDIMNEIYEMDFVRINAQTFTISNLFGGPYVDGTNRSSHDNWFRTMFERVLLTSIGVLLQLNPTMINLPIQLGEFQNAANVQPYYYLLFGRDSNLPNITKFIESIDRHLTQQTPGLPTLGSYLGKVSGIQILSHSVEPCTLPTWHTLSTVNISTRSIKKQSDATFASKINFLAKGPSYTGKLKFPSDKESIEPKLYLVENKDYNPQNAPVTYKSFNTKTDVLPDVFWFQPYSRSTSSISHSIVLGLKIELEEFDGTLIPIPNPASTLIDVNSSFLVGAVTINKVHTTMVQNTQAYTRVRNHSTHSDAPGINIVRRDCSRNILASFASSDVDATINGSFGYQPESDNNDISTGTTFCNWRSDEGCPYPDDTLYLWSSYRSTNGCQSPGQSKIYMYFTLRSLFGLNTVLSQTRNPAKLLPS